MVCWRAVPGQQRKQTKSFKRHDEYDDAMHAFVDMEHFSTEDLEKVTVKFFTVRCRSLLLGLRQS